MPATRKTQLTNEGEKVSPSARGKGKKTIRATKRTTSGGAKMAPDERLRRVQARIFDSMERIIAKVIEEAEKGKYTDARFLFELAGVTSIPMPESEKSGGGDSPERLAAVILQRLDEVAKDSNLLMGR